MRKSRFSEERMAAWTGARRGAASAGRRESAPEANGGGAIARHSVVESGAARQPVTVVDRDAVVDDLVDEMGRGGRRACALPSQPRSAQRHTSTRPHDPQLPQGVVSLASAWIRFGDPRPRMMLRRQGFAVGPRRVHGLHRALGLKLRSKRRRHGARAPRGRLPAATAGHERRSVDVASDQLADDRTVRVLAISDASSKRCPALEIGRRCRACASGGRWIERSSSMARPS